MPVVVLPRAGRWAGVLAAAAGLTVAALAAVPASASSHAAASGPSAAPRFIRAHPETHLPSGYAQICPQPSSAGVMQCSIVVHSAASPAAKASRPAPGALSPGQLRSAYGLSSAANASSKDTIAIVDAYNDWHAAGDLAKYRSYYGIPACTTSSKCLRVVNQKGTTAGFPKGNSGWAEEESLDLDMVSAICPHCKILLVEANNTTIGALSAAEDTAVRLGAKFISNSWGGSEFSTEASYDGHFDHQGVAITVASGDYGYGTQYPAVSPYVTAVGGTTLWMKGKTRTEEKVWSLGATEGTGSGCSALEHQPSWQLPFGSGCSTRIDNDVAADADPRTGPAVYDSYPPSGAGLPGGLAAARRDQRVEPDHRGRVRAGQPGRQTPRSGPGRFPLPGCAGPAGHHDRLERQLRDVPVRRRDRVRRPDRAGRAQRRERLQVTRTPGPVQRLRPAARSSSPVQQPGPAGPVPRRCPAGWRRRPRLAAARGGVAGGGGGLAEAGLPARGDQVVVEDAGHVVARLDDLALLQPDDPVASLGDLGQLVRDQEHRACLARSSSMRSWLLRWNSASPVASASSTSRMSWLLAEAIANRSRAPMPVE